MDAEGNVKECKTNIGNMLKKASEFMENRDVWDREELQGVLKATLARKGQFVCLLGGKSTGKSMILNNLERKARETYDTVFVVDLREHGSDISKGLRNVLEARLQDYMSQRALFSASLKEGQTALRESRKLPPLLDGIISLITGILDGDKGKKSLNALIDEIAKLKRDGIVTIIIDEASIAFSIIPGQTTEKTREVRQDLALFTRLTKQEKKANIILTSSEHTFPYSLRDLGLNSLDITKFIFAGEVTPDKALELLTQRWGVGPSLAVALIDHYGGNLYNIQQKLMELDSQGETFHAASQLQPDGVLDCLDSDVDKKRMILLLTQIAENGFAPLRKKTDPVAEVISKYNVGGLVQVEKITELDYLLMRGANIRWVLCLQRSR